MIRSMLQFVGFASTAIWSVLVLGGLITSTANANPIIFRINACNSCYGCNADNSGCNYTGSATGCTDTNNGCNCQVSGKYATCR